MDRRCSSWQRFTVMQHLFYESRDHDLLSREFMIMWPWPCDCMRLWTWRGMVFIFRWKNNGAIARKDGSLEGKLPLQSKLSLNHNSLKNLQPFCQVSRFWDISCRRLARQKSRTVHCSITSILVIPWWHSFDYTHVFPMPHVSGRVQLLEHG